MRFASAPYLSGPPRSRVNASVAAPLSARTALMRLPHHISRHGIAAAHRTFRVQRRLLRGGRFGEQGFALEGQAFVRIGEAALRQRTQRVMFSGRTNNRGCVSGMRANSS
jgi:hypothetical protein